MKRYWIAVLLGLFFLPLAPGLAQEEPLDPDKAFALQVSVVDARTLRAEWTIADGYYMYRDKFVFESGSAGVSIKDVKYPKSISKHDEAFGKVLEIYKHKASILITLSKPVAGDFTLKTVSQGCNEPIGLCYPPQRVNQTVSFATAPAAEQKTSLQSKAKSLFGDNKQQDDEPLPPDEAFQYSIEVVDGNTLMARWQIAEGYYMYQREFKAQIVNGDGVTIGEIQFPKAKEKMDQAFNETLKIYQHQLQLPILLKRSNGDAQTIAVSMSYQGCNEPIGLCYPKINKQTTLQLPAGATSTGLSWADVDLQNTDQVLAYLMGSSLFIVIGISIILGILIAFTACMYPMIPIVSSIIVGQGDENMSRGKGFFLTLVYVEAMALTFGIIGAIMGGIGGGVGLQAYFQSPWLLIPFATLFVLLALSMFGFYEIQVPSAIQSRVSAFSNQQKGGSLVGVGIMGALSALIIGPCGGPMLIAMLAYAAGIGTVSEGFIALFAFGNGMGLPLLVIGLVGGELLPRAGTWMDVVKATAGVILLAVALVFLERMPSIFPLGLTTFLWAALFIIAATYMGALDPVKEGSSGWSKLRKGVAVIIMLYGSVFFLASLTGGSGDLKDPLHGSSLTSTKLGSTLAGQGSASHFTQVKTVADLQAQLGKGQVVMLDFYADWCTYCKTYEKYVFPDPAVAQLMGQMNVIQADVTGNDAQDKALLKHVDVFLPPAILFFDKNGKELRELRIIGEMDAAEFQAHLQKVLAAAQ
jgi:thiol:disulfide interchange protein DsbD